MRPDGNSPGASFCIGLFAQDLTQELDNG
ncbi:protein of unknown function [Methylocella tundrae]|uniref:Uncharacterized protein n=1 Tax=Methylocella tundrae TaxID=227605 RepID=A0A4U8YVA7_METTU|nr:protein of unknown function [Methylocella tundrae]